MNDKPSRKTSIGAVPIKIFWAAGGILVGLLLLFIITNLGPVSNLDELIPSPTIGVSATASPTSTLTPTATPSPTTIPTPSPTATVEPPEEESFMVGDWVEIHGAEGNGLSGQGFRGVWLRVFPSLVSESRIAALEGNDYVIHAGPIEEGGQTWWYLANPFDNLWHDRGWVIADYLRKTEPW